MKLREDNKHVEFIQFFKLMVIEMKKVDQNLVLESVASGAKQVRVEDHRCLPNNFTDFSAIVMLASNTKFEKVKPWDNKKKHNELDKDGSEDREVSSLE